MSKWQCKYCKSKNSHKTKKCKRCNVYCFGKKGKYMGGEKRQSKKVYTSGPILNAASAAQAAQELWICVTNFDKHSVTVKVEVLNWGDPILSAGLTATGMSLPMNAMAVAVMPAEKVEIPSYRTQHFFVDLLTGGPLLLPEVLSYEIRITVISDDSHANVIFNVVSCDIEAEVLEADETWGLAELIEKEEELEAALPMRSTLVSFKDFVLLEMN